MRKLVYGSLLLLAASIEMSTTSRAAELIGEYQAFISENDLYNSSGERLTKPWEIIRQDRANYHKFGKADPEDGFDDFFASEGNRAIAERMLARGSIDPAAAQQIVDGNVTICIRIYGRSGRGDFIQIETPAPQGAASATPQPQGVIKQKGAP